MRIYLEIFELLDEDEELVKQPQQIRIEVESEADAIEKYQGFKQFFEGRKYMAQIHFCYHEEGLPCQAKTIEEVK